MITFSQLGRWGRLGNQMFQYALLVGVSSESGYEVAIPDDALLEFELSARRLAREQLGGLLYAEREASFCFDAEVIEQPDGTDFLGFFQSYRYFTHVTDRIRREFTFTAPVRNVANHWVEQMRQFANGRPLVGVHARRGDYVRSSRYVPFSTEYFERAKRTLDLDEALYAICSDDMAWAMKNFTGPDFFYLRIDDQATCLCAASHCDHFIISGSSYGWWAAWLGTHLRKQVVIPTPWYGPSFPFPETRNEMSPPDWRRVAVELPSQSRGRDGLTIVTAADRTHTQSLLQLLDGIEQHEPQAACVVYDLGMTPVQRNELQARYPRIELRRFEYERYPGYFDIRVNAGQYAWKPIIVAEVVDRKRDQIVVWMDAGNIVHQPLDELCRVTREIGLYSPLSAGTIRTWTHPKTLKYLHVDHALLSQRNLNAAAVAIDPANDRALAVIRRWRECALVVECISPAGSDRSNHRQDQAVLTVLAYQDGVAKHMPRRFLGFSTQWDVDLPRSAEAR